jgi:hypothetical protein
MPRKKSENKLEVVYEISPIDKEKLNNLRALYNHAYDETKHFRTFEWQITVWSTTLLGAIVSVTKFFTPNPNDIIIFKWLLGSFTVFFSISSIVHILHCHRSLTFNRALIRQIECEFQFHKMKIGDPPDELFPIHLVKPPRMSRGWFHLVTWIVAILSIAGFAINRIYAW